MTDTRSFQLNIPAQIEKLSEVLSFLEGCLEKAGCSPRIQMQLAVAVEEIFVNIAHYAYAHLKEQKEFAHIDVRFETDEEGKQLVRIEFRDKGRPFDPVAHTDPDITLSSAERQIGGLGIFMVKKSMDSMQYRYEDGCNILTITKYL